MCALSSSMGISLEVRSALQESHVSFLTNLQIVSSSSWYQGETLKHVLLRIPGVTLKPK